MRRFVFPVLLLALLLASCGTGKSSDALATPAPLATPGAPSWPAALPGDGVQPWETTDSAGHVIPAAKSSSSINGQSVFAAGVESFTTGGGTVTSIGEATRLDSGAAGAHALSYATYRLTLGGTQPGVVGLDVNPNNATSAYYVGLSDYAANRWVWRGPFSDNHIRLVKTAGQLDSANYLSASGNLFVAVAACDGSSVDVVGVGANPVTDGDAALPPAPAALAATPEHGGLLLEWTPSAAGDLAGYRILWSNSSFTTPTTPGVNSYLYSDGGGRLFLPVTPRLTYVAVQAVDIAGNVSALSPLQNAVPLGGAPPALTVTASAPSGLHDSAITLTATGAATYDFDLDGDGVYDVTGNTSGTANVDTSKPGIIRPGVRGHSADGSAVALGGVSLIITGNTRPAVSAIASPQAGPAPLDVTFTATAQDAEDAPAQLTYAWDFNGDGIFEPGTNQASLHNVYNAAATYNAVVRVTDTQGAWAAFPVVVVVGPSSQPPLPSFTVTAQPAILPMRLSYKFDGTGSFGQGLSHFDWDFDGDGIWDAADGPSVLSHTYSRIGTYSAKLRLRDGAGNAASVQHTLYVPSSWSSFAGVPGSTARLSTVVGAQTNNLKWSFTMGNWAESTAAFGADGTVYTASADHKVYAFVDNGTPTPAVKWSYDTGASHFYSGPALAADGTVYACDVGGRVVALVDNGTSTPLVKWSYNFGLGAMNSSPAVGPDGTLYIGTSDNKIYALVDNGSPTPTLKWSYTTGGSITYSSPAIGPDGTVYVGSGDQKVYALADNGTGTPTVKWLFLTSGSVFGGPAVGPDGTVYVGGADFRLYALVDNGTPTPTVRWSYLTGGPIYDTPAIGADGTVYVGGVDSKVYALHDNGTATPDVKWSFLTGGAVYFSPAIGADGTVYIGSNDDTIYALIDNGTATPTVKWSYTTAAGIYNSPSLGPDGRVYIGSDDFKFYCFGP